MKDLNQGGIVMPWSVRFQDESGEPMIAQDALIEFGTIPESGQFKLLHYIDRYSDTYFNQMQMQDFLADWDKLSPVGAQREQWQSVREMSTRCLNEYGLLHFIGD